jgi:hypothetical protein
MTRSARLDSECATRKIRRLDQVQADIIGGTLNVTDGPDDFVPTRLEV